MKNTILSTLLVSFCLLVFLNTIYSGTLTWEGTANWSTTGNWNTGVAPGPTDDIIISSGIATISDAMAISSLVIESGATVNVDGVPLMSIFMTLKERVLLNGIVTIMIVEPMNLKSVDRHLSHMSLLRRT